MDRYIIFGASRGLGSEIARLITNSSLLLISRNIEKLKKGHDSLDTGNEFYSFDLTDLNNFDQLSTIVKNYDPTHIYYVAGGGPYGKFEAKEFKDHMWAYKLNLLFPAQLIHWALSHLSLKQFIVVGSSVAEGHADPFASSYSSAKHGLKGLISSIHAESCSIDLRLFSPPYMNTSMLPKNSQPYKDGKVSSAKEVAKLFYKWANDADGLKHYFIEVE